MQKNAIYDVIPIGIGSYAFRWAIGTPEFRPAEPMSLIGFINEAIRAGAEAVQICDNLPIAQAGIRDLDAVQKLVQDAHLIIEIGMKGCQASQIRQHLEICDYLGSKVLRIVLDDQGLAAHHEPAIGLLRELAPLLEKTDVILAIENHFAMHPRLLADIVRRIDDPHIRICLDPLNSITHLAGPEEVIRLCASFAASVHVKDAVVRRQKTGFYVEGAPVGKGLVDIAAMWTAVAETGSNPAWMVESWMDRLESVEATLTQEYAWTTKAVGFLKTLRQQKNG